MGNSISPLVSVIMPAYNSERYIGEAIVSVLAQTFPEWELVVVDDCSNDGTACIAKRFSESDARVKVVLMSENGGVAAARNRGIAEACGAYVALLDSDDLWEPDKLELQVALAERSGAPIVYCSYDLISQDGQDVGKPFVVPPVTDFEAMLEKSVIGCSTCLISTEIMKTHPFSNEFHHEDYVLWMTLLREGYAACGCSEVLMHYRQIPGSRSSDKIKSAKGRWEAYRKGLGMPIGKSLASFVRYAVSGVRKYHG